MIYVALTAVAAVGVVTLGFTSVIAWLIRQQARERDLLQNKLLSLVGKPWQLPPAEEPEPLQRDLEEEFEDVDNLMPVA